MDGTFPFELACATRQDLNACVERFIQTIQQECLDHFVVVGERGENVGLLEREVCRARGGAK